MDTLITNLFNDWISQLGVDNVALDQAGMAALEIERGIIVNFQAQSSPPVLTLFALAGRVPEAHRAPLMRDMLEANLLWARTGGATLSLQNDAANGALDVVVAQAITVHKGSARTELQRAFDNLCLVALDWQARLDHPEPWFGSSDSGALLPPDVFS
jgi:hypothetical protein